MAVVAALLGVGPESSAAQDLPVPSTGQPEAVHLGIEEAIARALGGNPGLEVMAEKARSADRAAAESFRQHFGEVNAVAWTSRYRDPEILRPISKNLLENGIGGLPFAQEQFHYGLTFEVPLFAGGRLLAGSNLARLKADEASVLLEGTRWQVSANVTSVYSSAQALTAAVSAYGESVASLERTEARLQLMVEEGKRPEVDLLKASETLEEARAELADAQADLTQVTALLAALLGFPAAQTFELDPLPDRFPEMVADTADLTGMVEGGSAVAAAELRVRQAERGKQVARSQFLPTVSVRGNLLEHWASSLSESQETWELTLAASIPVFSGGRHTAAYQSAAATERAADLALQQTRLQQQAELRGALARFQAARTDLDAARRRVTAADEAARIEGLRYENGAGTVEDLLRARTRASAAEASLAKAKGDVLSAAAGINALAEREIVQ